MSRHGRRFAALAVAWLGCTPIASPTRRPGEHALEPIPDVSPPQPAADAVLDAAPAPVQAMEQPAEASTPGPPTFDPSAPWPPRAAPHETARDTERRRLLGSPADVHTPEGAARGYLVDRHCPNYAHDDFVAVTGTGRKHIPQLGQGSPSLGKRPSEEMEFWAFVSGVRRATAVSSIHAAATSAPCFGTDEDAVILYLHDWRQVDQAIRNVGSWLAAHDWYGDVILLPQPIPGPAYSK